MKQLLQGLKFAWQALLRIPRDAHAFATHQKTEEKLIAERLMRRYDPGPAMNEAFQRAAEKVKAGKMKQAPLPMPASKDTFINDYYENLRRNPPELTARQKAALAVQERMLRKNLRDQ